MVSITKALGGTTLLGAGALAYAYSETKRFTLRRQLIPVLPSGQSDLRVLHISDLHMVPGQHRKREWVQSLITLAPDSVIATGDFLSHEDAIPEGIDTLEPLFDIPGAFVLGSNDYFAPKLKNPAKYLTDSGHRSHGNPLPWQDLRAAFTERGWLDLTHNRRDLEVAGLVIAAAGVDDAHLGRDRYETIAGPPSPAANLSLGVTHAPYTRVLDRFAADGYQLVMAGHTHGGQLCLPFYGALVTNCDLDRSRVKGASRWGAETALHVSAGIGTSPFAPLRFCCRPEATLLTLVAAPTGGREHTRNVLRSTPTVSVH